jgi:hypothetical protein
MGYQKLTGSQAILGGAVILNSPIIYSNLTTSSTSQTKFYGTPQIEATTTDASRGGIKFGGATHFIKQIPFTSASWTTAVTTNFDTTWDLPAKSVVTDVFFDITTVASSLTLTAGTNGDPNGFLTAIPTTPVGVKVGGLLAAGQLYGALLTDQLCTTIAAEGKINYTTGSSAVSVAIGRSATNLDMSVVGNLYITYIVAE